MAQYFDDFESYGAASGIPSAWTGRWVHATPTWSTVDVSGAIEFNRSSTSAVRTMVSLNAVDSDADRDDAEVVAGFKATVYTATSGIGGVAVRGSGASGAETMYTLFSYGDDVRLYKYVAGTATVLGSTVVKNFATNTEYVYRLQVIGSALKGRAGSPEPGSWDFDTTDGDVTGTGWAGVFGGNGGSGGRAMSWTYVGIGTNGDAAPTSAPGGGITGSLAATESGSDTATLSGQVIVAGLLSATEVGADTAASAGQVIVDGDLAATESGPDTAAINGSVSATITGTLDATEAGGDTATLTGDVIVAGTIAATEAGADTAAISGSNASTGTLDATEAGADTAALTGDVVVIGAVAATEGATDAAALAGRVIVQGALAATETGVDTALINGSSVSTATGTLDATEAGGDTCVATGKALIAGLLAAVEGGADASAIVGQIIVSGALAAVEVGIDTAVIRFGEPDTFTRAPTPVTLYGPSRTHAVTLRRPALPIGNTFTDS